MNPPEPASPTPELHPRDAVLRTMAESYAAGLKEYLTGYGEGALERAYSLGRQGISLDLGVLRMTLIHQAALDELARGAESADECRTLCDRAAEFFAECLAPFEIVHRGFRESIEELKHQTEELAQANKLIERMSRARSAFLAEASRRLAATLDYPATLETVAQLPVPEMADWCAVLLVDDGGRTRVGAITHAQAERSQEVEALRAHQECFRLAGPGVGRTLRTGTSELLPTVTQTLLDSITADPESKRLLGALGFGSAVLAPLDARGNRLGALLLAAATPGRFGDDDLLLGEELARRASMALENARLYSDARRAIKLRDDFLSIASHELKTPLTPLVLKLQIAARRLKSGTPVDLTVLEAAIRNVERLTALINDLLDATRIEAGRLELKLRKLTLAPLVREMATTFQTDAGRPIELSIEGDPVVTADPGRIEQVLTNLLDNALKYSPHDGAVRVRLWVAGGEALFSVSDEGIGIPPAERERLFQRFFRAENAQSAAYGLGLGLYICRDIVERHGGRIWVESKEGEGSTFLVALPLNGGPPGSLEGKGVA